MSSPTSKAVQQAIERPPPKISANFDKHHKFRSYFDGSKPIRNRHKEKFLPISHEIPQGFVTAINLLSNLYKILLSIKRKPKVVIR